MATIPQSRFKGRLVRPPLPVIIAGALVLAVIATLLARSTLFQPTDPLDGGTQVAVTRGALAASIAATGKIEPRQQAELAFPATGGRVSAVLVTAGDVVAKDMPLVQLETRRLTAAVAAAEAALNQVEADLQKLKDGATPAAIAAARAQVSAAQGTLTQTQGSVTAADIQAARASVDQARARLAILQNGPKNEDLTRARTALASAQASLDQQRSARSAAKEQADKTIEQRANAVRDAQSVLSTAYWDREYALNNEEDPRTQQPLSDAQKQDFVSAYDQAQRQLADAEAALQQAQIEAQTARENERSGLNDTQAGVASAQADLDALIKGPDADTLAEARAQLAQAEANLAKLTGAQRQGAVQTQRGNLDAAQAQLDQLLASPQTSDLARAEASVAQAQAQLEQARINLDEATLRAPFAGTVATVNVTPGEQIGQQAPITLLDTSRYQVKITVDEIDIAKVVAGQSVDVLIEALGAPTLSGTVKRIAPQSEAGATVTAYDVTVEIDPAERPIKPGMTASATIVTERRENVLYVPAQAVRTENDATVVSIVTTNANGQLQLTTQPIVLGLRAGDQIEVQSGLSEGQQVLLK
jgi:HlyD family secretion protein